MCAFISVRDIVMCAFRSVHVYVDVHSGLFLVNILISTALTVYIVIYPAQWIVELMEVGLDFRF